MMRMNFDYIIMNPPYQRNLHLKILAKAINHLKDDGICVNLSPVLWIENPHAHTKTKSNLTKFSESICKHIEAIDIIDTKQANELFNISLFSNLGIYKCKQICNNNIDENTFWQRNFTDWEIKLFNKVYDMPNHLSDVCERNKRSGIRVLLTDIAGNRGTLPIYKDISYAINGEKDGLDWTKCKNNGGYEKVEGSNIPLSIEFESENAAQNFYYSYKTTFMKWLCKRFLFNQNIQFRFLPFMDDYTKPWTNEDFYKYFNITTDEQHIIEETMKKYEI